MGIVDLGTIATETFVNSKTVGIVDNLNSISTNTALSANQGRVLYDGQTNLQNQITTLNNNFVIKQAEFSIFYFSIQYKTYILIPYIVYVISHKM